MAKHPHRIMLQSKKTWRCTLPGCGWFVHLGLQHILPGKQSICWECNEEFTLDEYALKDDQPKCASCRSGGLTTEIDDVNEAKRMLENIGIESIDDLTLEQQKMLEDTGLVRPGLLDTLRNKTNESQE